MSLETALAAQDSICHNPPYTEWSQKDKQQAIDGLHDAIMNGELWDERLEGWRMDMFVDIERILIDDDDDKLGRIKDIQFMAIRSHCISKVSLDPDQYCERFCNDDL